MLFTGILEVAIALLPLGGVALAPIAPLSEPPALEQIAQQSQPGDLLRARNLARQAAERANGGLSRYRAEAAMHGIGALPVQDQGDRWVFRFVGGAPGSAPTIETVVTVTRDFEVALDYNGAIR